MPFPAITAVLQLISHREVDICMSVQYPAFWSYFLFSQFSPCFIYITLVILAILHLCLVRYFPNTNLVDRADNCYTSLYFCFSSFSMFIQSRISKLVFICSCCSFLFFPPIYLYCNSCLFIS